MPIFSQVIDREFENPALQVAVSIPRMILEET